MKIALILLGTLILLAVTAMIVFVFVVQSDRPAAGATAGNTTGTGVAP